MMSMVMKHWFLPEREDGPLVSVPEMGGASQT